MAGHGTVAVIGLGRFCTSIAIGLTKRGAAVLAVDISEHVVQRLADELPQIVCADGTDVVALQQSGVCAATTQAVVAIRSQLVASMLCTLALTEILQGGE
ncbi:MAG TPA: hypothetical protein DGG94_07275 [Micromonosporaceae bacterium]|nr:hypothetical protein [Micromonosporaceae bacterium]